MTKTFLENLIRKIQLQLLILRIQLQIKLLREKRTIPNLPQPKEVVVHHGAANLDFAGVNRYHKDKVGFKYSLDYYIVYQKCIEFTGKLYIGRRDNEKGAHTVDPARPGYWNKNSVGICLQGNTEFEKPREWQLITLKDELDGYVARGFKINAHKDIVPTSCPGNFLYQWLKNNKYI